jgi:AcrR family transcriptional regulator
VREIATDAGVNVALINRYFDSKEGLFEACLSTAAADVTRSSDGSFDQAVQTIVSRISAPPGDEDSLHLLLLLRTSGDERADSIRRKTLRTFAERIAALVGWEVGQDGDDELLLRAEIAIAMSLGITLLRTSGVEPLTSAAQENLMGPIGDAFSALLRRA